VRLPQIIPAHNLAHEWPCCDVGDGSWTPARPEPGPGGLRWRLTVAWRVFKGEYDALRWRDQ
jgi:hypothetical protein